MADSDSGSNTMRHCFPDAFEADNIVCIDDSAVGEDRLRLDIFVKKTLQATFELEARFMASRHARKLDAGLACFIA
jgi:hypothetical protein